MEVFVIVAVLAVLGLWHMATKNSDSKVRSPENEHPNRTEEPTPPDSGEQNVLAVEQAYQEASDSEWLEIIEEQEKAQDELVAFVGQHERTLLIKQRQLLFTDDYGHEDLSAFIKELEYFVEKVVPLHIRQAHIKHHGEDATLMMTATVRICLFDTGEATGDISRAYGAGMSGIEFERLVAERLTDAGAEVRVTPPTGDQGADLIVCHNGETIVIQCKRSASTVGNKAVQEAYAGRKFYDADHAWVVSDAPFSRSARQLASSLSVQLIDFDEVEAAL